MALTPDSAAIDRCGLSFPKSSPGYAIGNNLAPMLAGKGKFLTLTATALVN